MSKAHTALQRSLHIALFPFIASAALLSFQAHAQGKIPPMHEKGAVQYSCGGIGKDESTAMRAAIKDYPLSLLFATRDGDYLADISVDIQSAQGSTQFTANGPVCLVKLPAGSYKLTATTTEGQRQSQSVQTGKDSHSLNFRF